MGQLDLYITKSANIHLDISSITSPGNIYPVSLKLGNGATVWLTRRAFNKLIREFAGQVPLKT